MVKNNKKPRLRFKGFTDEWEQRKVSDLAYRYDNLRLPITAKDRISGRTPYYGANGIQDYVQGFTHEGEFVLIAEDGANDIKNYPVQYVNGQIWVNNHAHVLQANENNITLFIKYLITSSNIASILVGGGRSKLNSDALMNFEISIPIKQEQQKIAKLFLNLDNLITLHQRKYDKLLNVKKALLDKMFPKNQEKTPKIRFKGFFDAWEQRKLGEVATYRRGSFPQPYGKKEWYDGKNSMPFVQVVDVTENMNLADITKQRISSLAQPMSIFAQKGSVLVTLQGSIGRVAITQYGAFIDRTILIFEQYKEKICKIFWGYTIKQKFIEEAKQAPGGTIKTITKEVLSNFKIYIPNIEEQNKIGNFFYNLDNLITLHQRECEKLKNIKKALLDKMFV